MTGVRIKSRLRKGRSVRNCPSSCVLPPERRPTGRVEAPKGELAFYLVSDGSIAPYGARYARRR